MYGMLIAAAAMLVVVVEVLWRGAGVRRSVGFRGALPLAVFAVVGGVAQEVGASFLVYSSMYFLAFVSAFLGPLLAAISDLRGGRRARGGRKHRATTSAWRVRSSRSGSR